MVEYRRSMGVSGVGHTDTALLSSAFVPRLGYLGVDTVEHVLELEVGSLAVVLVSVLGGKHCLVQLFRMSNIGILRILTSHGAMVSTLVHCRRVKQRLITVETSTVQEMFVLF